MQRGSSRKRERQYERAGSALPDPAACERGPARLAGRAGPRRLQRAASVVNAHWQPVQISMSRYHLYQRRRGPAPSAARNRNPSSHRASTMSAIHHRTWTANPTPKRIRASSKTAMMSSTASSFRLTRFFCPCCGNQTPSGSGHGGGETCCSPHAHQSRLKRRDQIAPMRLCPWAWEARKPPGGTNSADRGRGSGKPPGRPEGRRPGEQSPGRRARRARDAGGPASRVPMHRNVSAAKPGVVLRAIASDSRAARRAGMPPAQGKGDRTGGRDSTRHRPAPGRPFGI